MEAYVTVVSDNESALGGVVLAESLHRVAVNNRRHYVALITDDNINSLSRQLLSDVFTHVYYASEICSNDDLALTLLGKPEVASTFAKIHCWRLTQYTKCVYLEADTLVLQNCDDLFEREELSAVPDVGWPDCFNAGVFVFRPSLNTYAQLISLVNSTNKYNFQGGDQSLLNTYFKDWRNDLTKRLPFVYNVFPNQQYTYAPALKYFSSGIKIIHYYKPWSASWPSESSGPSTDLMDNWAAIFKNKVVPKLPESTQELVRNSKSGSATQLLQRMEQSPSVISHIPSAVSHISSTISHISSTISHISSAKSSYHSPQSTNVNVESSSSFEWKPDHSSPDNIWNVSHLEKPDYKSESAEQISHYETPSSANAEPLDPYWEAVLWDSVKSPWDPPLPVQVQDFPSSFTERGAQEDVSSPTFGWFSSDSGAQQSTFDEPRTAPQPFPEELASISSDIKEIELGPETEERSTERMKAWEEGKIDYLGKDRFDNIWRRLEGLLRDPEDIEPEDIEEFVDDSLEFSENHFESELLNGTNEEEVICEDEAAVPEADSISVGYPGYAEGDWSGMYEWQEGRIDYTGKDRSDNILKRLDLVMSGGVVPSAITRFDL